MDDFGPPHGFAAGCCICRWRIWDTSPSWRNEFRLLWQKVENGDVALTGVGIYNDPKFLGLVAPVNPNARHDDDPFVRSLERLAMFPFAMHDACWRLLEKALSPKPVPLERVFQILNSLVRNILEGSLDWGYGYGGEDQVTTYFPWEAPWNLQVTHDAPYADHPVEINLEGLLALTYGTREGGQADDSILSAERSLELSQHIQTQILKLIELIELEWQDLERFSCSEHWVVGLGGKIPSQGKWIQVAGSLENAGGPLPPGCRELYWWYFNIPNQIIRVSVETVEIRGFEYLSNLWMEGGCGKGENLITGYKRTCGGTDKQEHHVELQTTNPLTGFNVAVGIGGIHALQCVDSKGEPWGPWLGNPENAAKTSRLGTYHMLEMRAAWDGFRIVSLAATVNDEAHQGETPNTATRLRQYGIWYPDFPPKEAGLNERVFLPKDSYTVGFKPLVWTQFGGPKGRYLKNLTRMSCDGKTCLFKYNSDDVPVECRVFGRPPSASKDQKKTTPGEGFEHFAIDGPGRERIVAVSICQKYKESSEDWLGTDGKLSQFTVYTSYGRFCRFLVDEHPSEGWVDRKKVFARPKNTVITGFYGAKQRGGAEDNLVALGVMTVCGGFMRLSHRV